MWASASFVGVLIIIGLPLWWKTTEVYRVALPYDKISSFDQLPRKVAVDLKILAYDDVTAADLEALIEKAFEDSDIIKPRIQKAVLSDELHHALEYVADELDAVEEINRAYNLTERNCFYLVQRRNLFQHVWLGEERVMFFRDSEASRLVVESLLRWVYQTSVLSGVRSETVDAARSTRLPPAAGYHVVLSVVHPTPDKLEVEFDAKEAVEDYIGTFVDELSYLHNFTLKSQWLYLLDFNFQAKEVKDINEDRGRHFSVRRDRLHLLLTSLEERAATHVAALPTINLALYIVPCHLSPLQIYYDDDKPVQATMQAFMSPKWGGVVFASPSAPDCGHQHPAFHPHTRLVMGTFLAQLRPLLGIPEVDYIPDAFLVPLRSVSARKWEVDSLVRLRTLEQITSAQRTLQSLAQLLGEISNIVITDEVGASINSAVESIQEASHLLAEGDIMNAYDTSKRAYLAAETAFMDPSLLALLYFPDDQKYAIYIPLFLPIMFPVVLSLKNLLLWFRGKPVHKDKIE
ncbi:hypothetical protein evm_007403 [Chilo suppressalis]|nr:hypothetical protein evm_007403 [Chilo suppressalis]